MLKQLRYLAGRLFYAVLTVWVLTTATFLLMHLLPGDPFSGDKTLRPEVQEALTVKYGLDKSIPEQYGIYLSRVLEGDLGSSLVTGRQVTDIIAQTFPISLELGVWALVCALIIGLPLGIAAALRRGTVWDTGMMLFALIGVSVPSFILGSLLQYFLGLRLYQITGVHIFPIMGWAEVSSKLLPSFALAFTTIAVISRLMRASLIDVMSQDYIRTARAKGLLRQQVVFHHGLRNAIMPVLTVLGPLVAVLFTGTFVIENIFSIPGLGRYFVESVQSNDYPVIIGTTLFFGIFLVGANLVVDILHGLIDPRVGAERGRGQ